MQADLDRIASGEEPAPRLRARDALPPPPPEGAAAGLSAWQDAVSRASAAAEAQAVQSLNLELASRFGVAAWKAHASADGDLDRVLAGLKASSAALRARIDQLNAARAAAAESQAQRLRSLVGKRQEATDTATHLELACADAEREVKRLRTEAVRLGLDAGGAT